MQLDAIQHVLVTATIHVILLVMLVVQLLVLDVVDHVQDVAVDV